MFLSFEIFTINYSFLLSIKKNVLLIILAFWLRAGEYLYQKSSFPSNRGKGWYYYCIFDYFGVFWASEQCVFRHMVYLKGYILHNLMFISILIIRTIKDRVLMNKKINSIHR